jgi:predicted house-cleaning noncanonical NTP pyrophosphatase (MazG superfamily)
MPIYNKLVRDKIPEIIEKSGKRCVVKELDVTTYVAELKNKLIEELNEYLQAKDETHAIEELADVLEVMHSLSHIHGIGFEDIDGKRQQKFQERGGFHDKIYLIEVSE